VEEENYLLLLMKILEERSYKISLKNNDEDKDFEENPWKPENVYLGKPYTI
jgi:hypothetical protein